MSHLSPKHNLLSFPIIRESQGKRLMVDITNDPDLIDQSFALRYKVFNLELGEGLKASHATARDQDAFDAYCDHLIVLDLDTNTVVGTYRIMQQKQAKQHIGFYSETEFDLTNIYQHLPQAAEIGRCCVHAEYRSGLVMNLLWHGLALYMEQNKVSHLFGCTSLNKGDTSQQASMIYKICEQENALAPTHLHVSPKPDFKVKTFNPDFELPRLQGKPKRLLPGLLRAYLSVGTQVCGEPAFDPEFGVIDFFTLFEFESIAKAARRFLPKTLSDNQ